MLKARKQLAQQIPDSTHTQKLNMPKTKLTTVSYTHLTLPTNREV